MNNKQKIYMLILGLIGLSFILGLYDNSLGKVIVGAWLVFIVVALLTLLLSVFYLTLGDN